MYYTVTWTLWEWRLFQVPKNSNNPARQSGCAPAFPPGFRTAYGPCGLVLNIVKVGEPLVLIRKYHAQNPPPPEKLKPYTLIQAPKPNSQTLTPCLKARSPETPKQLHVHGDTKDGRHLGLCSGFKGLGRRDLTLSFWFRGVGGRGITFRTQTLEVRRPLELDIYRNPRGLITPW